MLTDLIEKSVKSVIDVLMGRKMGDQATKLTFESIQKNQTPLEWQQQCYPSFTTLTNFIDNLQERI